VYYIPSDNELWV